MGNVLEWEVANEIGGTPTMVVILVARGRSRSCFRCKSQRQTTATVCASLTLCFSTVLSFYCAWSRAWLRHHLPHFIIQNRTAGNFFATFLRSLFLFIFYLYYCTKDYREAPVPFRIHLLAMSLKVNVKLKQMREEYFHICGAVMYWVGMVKSESEITGECLEYCLWILIIMC